MTHIFYKMGNIAYSSRGMSIKEENYIVTSEFYLIVALIAVDATHLFPRLWLFLCRAGGGVGKWDTTDVSGQVGLRLYFTEKDSSDGPDVKTNTNIHQTYKENSI